MNSPDERWFALSPQDVSILIKAKHPFHIIEFVLIPSDDEFMPLTLFPRILRLNIVAYIKWLEDVVQPGLKLTTERPNIRPQDIATYSTTRKI